MQIELNEQIKLLSSQLEVLQETTQQKDKEFKAWRKRAYVVGNAHSKNSQYVAFRN